eukprot:jgi/Mesvir1/19046/Mv12809-RA.1
MPSLRASRKAYPALSRVSSADDSKAEAELPKSPSAPALGGSARYSSARDMVGRGLQQSASETAVSPATKVGPRVVPNHAGVAALLSSVTPDKLRALTKRQLICVIADLTQINEHMEDARYNKFEQALESMHTSHKSRNAALERQQKLQKEREWLAEHRARTAVIAELWQRDRERSACIIQHRFRMFLARKLAKRRALMAMLDNKDAAQGGGADGRDKWEQNLKAKERVLTRRIVRTVIRIVPDHVPQPVSPKSHRSFSPPRAGHAVSPTWAGQVASPTARSPKSGL